MSINLKLSLTLLFAGLALGMVLSSLHYLTSPNQTFAVEIDDGGGGGAPEPQPQPTPSFFDTVRSGIGDFLRTKVQEPVVSFLNSGRRDYNAVLIEPTPLNLQSLFFNQDTTAGKSLPVKIGDTSVNITNIHTRFFPEPNFPFFSFRTAVTIVTPTPSANLDLPERNPCEVVKCEKIPPPIVCPNNSCEVRPPAQGSYPPVQGGYQGSYQSGYQGEYQGSYQGSYQTGYPPLQGGYPPIQSGYTPGQSGYGPRQSGYYNEGSYYAQGTYLPVLPSACFTANPSKILLNQTSILKWSCGVTSGTCSITPSVGGNLPPSCTSDTSCPKVSPSNTTTYTLTCTGAIGSTTATLSVFETQIQETQPSSFFEPFWNTFAGLVFLAP